jgi:hypothetical protein
MQHDTPDEKTIDTGKKESDETPDGTDATTTAGGEQQQ